MSDIRHVGKIKAPLLEIQVNGGSVDEKVQWAFDHFEKDVRVHDVFNTGDFLDVLGATKGHGYEGTTARYGVRKLPRKTHTSQKSRLYWSMASRKSPMDYPQSWTKRISSQN